MTEFDLKRILQVPKKEINYDCLVLNVVCFFAGIVLMLTLQKCQPSPAMLKSHSDVKPTMQQVQMQEYFRIKGSSDPEKMAEAVLLTKRPRLMAAIAVRESGGNPKAVGDGGKSKGAFQVQKRHWGVVSNDVVDQALQSERILEELLADNKGNLQKALNAYNGDTRKKIYANNILKELEQIP